MKIHIDNVNVSAPTGPNVFAKRLSKAFIESGHEIEFNDGTECDVSLVFIEPSGAPLAKKTVARLDGIWFKPEEFLTKNRHIKLFYQATDAVIFQSQFDKSFITKWWGEHEKSSVITNGIRQAPVTKFSSPELEKIRGMHKKIFVCSANWHPQKRLDDNIKLFQHIKKTIEPNSCCIVLGNGVEKQVPGVFYCGSIPENLCLEVFAMSDWMLHLAWLDHSPNSVVESLSQSTPVMCSENGGTKELVGDFGIILKEQNPYSFTLENYDNPPTIDVSQITMLPEKNALGQHVNIDIGYVANAYIDFFKTL